MDKNSLRKLISDKLGISSSKKDFAFEVFLKKISQTLSSDEAINVPGIGFFQLKNEPLLKEERKTSRGQKKLTKRTVFYSPIDSKDKNELSLFLSFDVDLPSKDFTEFDENVFSLGIQKLLAPIFDEDESISSLQKSLESRIDEIIYDSQKVNDFDLFENYVNQVTEENLGTAEVEENEALPEIATEELHVEKLENENEEIIDEKLITESKDSSESEEKLDEDSLEIIEDQNIDEVEEEINPFDELDKLKFDNDELKPEETNSLLEEDVDTEKEKKIEFEDEKVEVKIKKKFPPTFEELFENDDDLLESVLPVPGKENSNEDVEIEEEENIEWDWGDELKSEFQEEPEEEKNIDTDITEIDMRFAEGNDENPADELENEFDDSIDLEADLDDEKSDDAILEIVKEEKKEKIWKKPAFPKFDRKSKSFGKSFWILLSTFVLFTIFGLYYLLFYGGNKPEVKEAQIIVSEDTLAEDTLAVENAKASAEQEIAKVDTAELIIPEPIKVADVEPEPVVEPLYRTFENEVRVNHQIYSDGNRFMVQVSSFKSKNRAELDASRYQSNGHDAFIVEADLPQLGGTWYRVRVGYFKNQKEAEEFISKNNL